MAAKKIQIKKRVTTDPKKKVVAKHHEPLAQSPSLAPVTQPKKPGLGPLFIKLGVVVAVLAGCAIFFVKVQREATVRPRLEAIERRQRMDSVQESASTVERALSFIVEAEARTSELVEQADKHVLFVLGVPIEKPAPEIVPAVKQAPQGSPAKATKTESKAAPEEADKPKPRVKKPESARDAPVGMLTREQLEARRRGVRERREREKTETGSEDEPSSEQELETDSQPDAGMSPPAEMSRRPGLRKPRPGPDTPIEELPIDAAGRRLVALREHLSAKLTAVRETEDLVRKRRDEAKVTPHLYRLEEIQKELKGSAKTAARLQEEAGDALALAEQAMERIAALRGKFEEEKREAERIAAERRRAEEHRKRVELEKTWATEDEAAARQLFRKFQYSEALTRLKDGAGRYQTDPGRSAHSHILDRYVYLDDLKSFLIEQINAKPFKWGWGKPPSARDVLSADNVVITLRGAEAVWTDVDEEQMQKFIDHYVDDRALRRRQRARLLMGAAVYFRESGNGILAKKYASKAVSADAPLRTDSDRFFE